MQRRHQASDPIDRQGEELMDEPSSFPGKLITAGLVLVGLVLLLPLTVFVALTFYALAVFEGIAALFRAARPAPGLPAAPLPGPHLLDVRRGAEADPEAERRAPSSGL